MIRATQADLPQITAFLHKHHAHAMFPLSNPSRYGLDGDAPRSPALRGKGHARRTLALHLAQVKTVGVKRATLFTASEMAERFYAAIGFQRVGLWTLLLFQGKVVGHV